MKTETPSIRTRGRPLKYDPNIAVDAAMRVFWLKGYEGASLSDLTEAMGINKPSLYAKYGDKRGLFLASIDHYRATITAPHVTPIAEGATSRGAIAGYFASIIATFADTGSPPGCLIGTVATDLAGRDPEIRGQVTKLVSGAEGFLTQRFKELGDCPLDERILAELVVSMSQSFAARARMGASVDELEEIAARFLTAIFGPQVPEPPD